MSERLSEATTKEILQTADYAALQLQNKTAHILLKQLMTHPSIDWGAPQIRALKLNNSTDQGSAFNLIMSFIDHVFSL